MSKTTKQRARAIGEWLSEEELKQVSEAFAGLEETGQFWRALMLLLRAGEAEAAEWAVAPGLDPVDRQYVAGRAAGARDVRDRLEAARTGSLKAMV